ncbi:MAG: hypothetical protein IT483_00070 [Gammaproteobacteria bacterium]|nr:hypothetical protein [Gammaproteobacteria bacterium]
MRNALLITALLLGLAAATSSSAQSAPAAAPPAAAQAGPWRELLAADLAFVRSTLETRYIYAVYPGAIDWEAVHGPALARATEAAAQVKDFAGYRSVLSQYVSAFRDPHLRLNFGIQVSRYQWPGLALRYRDGRYLVGTSRLAGVTQGAEITACDGTQMDQWIDELAALDIGVPGVESTRASLAGRLLVDAGNPFYRRPAHCTIGGVETTLAWTPISAEAWAAATAPSTEIRDVATGLSSFGSNGEWIRLPAMTPRSKADADLYHEVIRQAQGLRKRDVIVFDVRGNGGGSYNWFMAILNALYGHDYASYYARERLRITPVFVAATFKAPPKDAPPDPFATPADTDLDSVIDDVRQVTLPNGHDVTVMGTSDEARRARPAGGPPANPVSARVYVLTDYGCGSSCMSFVDEMLQFPGVRQVGLPTGVDMRSGSPLPYPLPSTTATLLVPSMVRENRVRGENVPWLPSSRFHGDIADTAALQRWIREDVMRESARPEG